MKNRCVSLPVFVVLSATAFVYYTTVFVVTDQWLSLGTAPGLLNAIIFTGLTAMSVLCYTLAIIRDPGQVPSSYVADLEDSDSSMHEVKRKVCFSSFISIPIYGFCNIFFDKYAFDRSIGGELQKPKFCINMVQYPL
jgi:hypothetical protein